MSTQNSVHLTKMYFSIKYAPLSPSLTKESSALYSALCFLAIGSVKVSHAVSVWALTREVKEPESYEIIRVEVRGWGGLQ